MSVKKQYKFGKIIFYSLIGVSLSILLLYVLLDNIILSRNVISNLEYNDMKSKIYQAQSILNFKSEELEKVAKDYGVWEECYYKAQEKDIEWFKENFSDWMPDNFNIDLILVANKEKEILNQYGTSRSNQELLENEIIESILSNKYDFNDKNFPSGFKIYNKQLYILGVSPILQGYGNKDVQGLVIVGKKITQDFITDIDKQFGIRMSINYDNSVISSEYDYETLKNYLNEINNKSTDVISLGEAAIVANTRILDIASKEIGNFIVLEAPRTFLSAIKLMRKYSILVLFLCIIMVLTLSLKIKKYIERPLYKLTNQIYEMVNSDNIIMVDSSGPYEIIKLANAFNNLLVKLRMKQEENIILENSSNTDALTSLYNKKYFLEFIDKIALEKKNKFYLIFCDIDYFKKINDEYGHQIGDVVLKETGSIIKKVTEDKGKAFRYGGEEFAIILDCIEIPLNIAEAIRMSVSSSETLKKVCSTSNVTISLGIAAYPEDAQDIENLIRKADIAMYYAKKNGRNQCQVFNRDMEV